MFSQIVQVGYTVEYSNKKVIFIHFHIGPLPKH